MNHHHRQFMQYLRAGGWVKVTALPPAPRVKDLQAAVAEILGWNAPVKLASPMMASTLAVGTPVVQLAAVPHAVLVVPFQEVCAGAGDANKNRHPASRKSLPID